MNIPIQQLPTLYHQYGYITNTKKNTAQIEITILRLPWDHTSSGV